MLFSGFQAGKRINGELYVMRDGVWLRLSMMAKLQAESIKGS